MLWVAGIVMLTLAVDAALLHSKQPMFLFWSAKKLIYCTGLIFLGGLCLRAAAWLKPGELHAAGHHPKVPELLFLGTLGLLVLLKLGAPASIDGDLGYQAEGLRQYVSGQVESFNALRSPIKDSDLAGDRTEPIVWFPPGPMLLLLPLLKLGIPIEWAAQLLLLAAYCCGGLGYLRLAGKMGLGHPARLAFAAVLALAPLSRDGLGFMGPTSADNLGVALFPWLALATIRLVELLQAQDRGRRLFAYFVLTGLSTGMLYWVKYSWFVAGAALAGFLGIAALVLVRKTPFAVRAGCMALYSAGFFLPFLALNQYNAQRAGYHALEYSESASIGDNGFVNMVYGPNFSATARPQELPFSVLAGPGFVLGGNLLATKAVNLGKNVPAFNDFFQKRGTNTHVWALILMCLPMSLAAAWLLREHARSQSATHAWFPVAMVLIPVALLAYLSLGAQFNFVVKDNYRYVIPYSLLLQALLLEAWFQRSGAQGRRLPGFLLAGLVFWVVLFPNTWSLRQLRPGAAPMQDSTHVETVGQLRADGPGDASITFVLNGHGPRKHGLGGRTVEVPFLLDGGVGDGSEQSAFHTSQPIRIIVVLEANLGMEHPAVQGFLGKFPLASWQEHGESGPRYPVILYADMEPRAAGRS